jgi:hypothetical protein
MLQTRDERLNFLGFFLALIVVRVQITAFYTTEKQIKYIHLYRETSTPGVVEQGDV